MLGGRQFIKFVNSLVRKLSAFTHFLQYLIEWGSKPVPGWFDHNIELHYSWHKTRNPLSWERGIFGLLAMNEGANVLELCCGGGFNSYYFYSIRARHITAMDIDADAISSAQRYYKAPNLKYLVGDIRRDIPDELFNNIVIDASLEYFSEDEILKLMHTIKSRLARGGIMSGYSIVQQILHDEWRYVFKTKEDLVRFLRPYFRNIRVFETIYPGRHNMYFYAGDGELPFDENWNMQTVWRRHDIAS
jgi:SAM-dependent methyltransferase